MTRSIDEQLARLAREVGQGLLTRGEAMATAESCTGGLIAKLLTDIPGSSRWFERGIVSYSNAAKQELLGVSKDVIDTQGAVSAATVIAMADGLLARAPVQWTASVSGIAGPDGGTPDKPVGTVWIGWAGKGIATSASRFVFTGDREAVREQTAVAALGGLLALLAA
jgi:nicotinamide-nucleotide amidase